MWEDPIVEEVRRVREELAAKFGFDVKAIFADLRARQQSLGDRLVPQKNTEAKNAENADPDIRSQHLPPTDAASTTIPERSHD